MRRISGIICAALLALAMLTTAACVTQEAATDVSGCARTTIRLAITRPEMISRLVLVGCPLAPPDSGASQSLSPEYLRQRAVGHAQPFLTTGEIGAPRRQFLE